MPPETVSGTKQIVTKPLAVHQTTQGRRIKKKTRRGRRRKRKRESLPISLMLPLNNLFQKSLAAVH